MFDYFYGKQSDQFSFYRVPKSMYTEEKFRELSSEAKTLYGMLLDRMDLSAKNGWIDEKGRVYVIFTIREVMKALSCAEHKACRMMSELEDIGLIRRKRCGQGKPTRIYVKNFISMEDSSVYNAVDNPVDNFSELPGQQSLNCSSDNSAIAQMTIPGQPESQSNDTDINDTEISDTDPILSDGCDEMRDRSDLEQYFREAVSYDILLEEYPYDKETLEGILFLLVDTCSTKKKKIRICGEDKPAEVVKSQLMKLNIEHIRYVLHCLQENNSRIQNPKQYLLSALYNAPLTINTYYQSMVNNDMANGLI